MGGATLRIVGAVAACSLLLAGVSAIAEENSHQRGGSCSGPGDWRLEVKRAGATTLRIRFDILHARPADSWQVFLSDDGTRVFAGTRIADAGGALRVVQTTRDRPGRDRIKGGGVNVAHGGSCLGAVTS